RVSHARLLPRPQALFLLVVEPKRALRDRVARVQVGQREAPLPAHERGKPVHLCRGRELRQPRRASLEARSPRARSARRLRARSDEEPGPGLEAAGQPAYYRRGEAGHDSVRRERALDAAHAAVTFVRDVGHWLYKLSPDEWLRAAMGELRR